MKFINLVFAFTSLMMLSCSNNKSAVTPPVETVVDTSAGKITPWLTTGDEKMLLSRQPALPFIVSSAAGTTITIDSAQSYQSMDGFGYTLTSGSAQLINNMPGDFKSKLLQELFGKTDNSISINFLRISIGASDLSASVYTYNEVPEGQTDPTLAEFSLEPDMTDLIPLLKEIITIKPDLRILATPWTPPLWMKDNGNSIGGSLKTEYYGAYADYFVKYIQEMKKEGITIYAVTPQNEPLHPENNPSLLMTADQQKKFIKDHLGPAFASSGVQTKIIIYDHNCDRPEYPLTILNDPAAKQYVDGSAFHLYAGDITAMSQVHDMHPDRNVYFTEQYTASTGQFAGDLKWHVKNLIVGAARNWSKTVLEWNLANDINFGPHTPGGCTTCKGALTIDGGATKRNVAYYIVAHASKFVPSGSLRVASNITGDLHNVAYKTPDGNIVLIVLNDGGASATFSIKVGDRSATASLPAGAVGTYIL